MPERRPSLPAPRRTLKRRLFQLWFRLSRPATLGVRALVRDEQGRILLVRHTYAPGWAFPGGGVERRQTALQALRHELLDEAGIRLTSEHPRLFAIYANHAIFPNDHVLLYVIEAGDYRREPWQPGMEIAEARFFPPDELPPDITPGTLRRIGEVLEDIPPAAEW